MITELFTYEIVDQNKTQLRIKRVVWWSNGVILVVDDDGKSESWPTDDFLEHLKGIGFPFRCLQILRSIFEGLQRCGEKKDKSNG